MSWSVEPFSSVYDRTGFDCGKPTLNQFLHQHVSQYERRDVGRTFVLIDSGQPRVLGYHTLVSFSVPLSDFPPADVKKLPRHPVPVTLLGRLAVDISTQGRGAGAVLMRDALARCLLASTHVASYAVFVDALDNNAANFYRKFGFLPLPSNPLRLFLKMADVRTAIGP
jgi:GNAT superfamily N-acetyltransferase